MTSRITSHTNLEYINLCPISDFFWPRAECFSMPGPPSFQPVPSQMTTARISEIAESGQTNDSFIQAEGKRSPTEILRSGIW